MRGILSGPVDGPARVRAVYPDVTATPGLEVRHRASGFAGKVVRANKEGITVRGRTGMERILRYVPGAFEVDGRSVSLVRPAPAPAQKGTTVTASGSVAVAGATAKVALPSRILVEGVHDAELVEKVWGDDLR